MANSDPDLKWLIITASCQRVTEVNLSVYWTTRDRSRVVGVWTAGHRAAGERAGTRGGRERERKSGERGGRGRGSAV